MDQPRSVPAGARWGPEGALRRLPDLGNPGPGRQQRGGDLSRAHRMGRRGSLVDPHVRAGLRLRSRSRLRHLREPPGQLLRNHRAGLDRSGDRPALSGPLSGDHHPRHGGGAARPGARARRAAGADGDRRLPGRDAGARVDPAPPGSGGLAGLHRLDRPPFRLGHRLLRGPEAGHLLRPALEGRPVPARAAAQRGAFGGPDAGHAHLPQRALLRGAVREAARGGGICSRSRATCATRGSSWWIGSTPRPT